MGFAQNMARLPSVMSIYNIETMLGSRFIFNNDNTHNGLIFDPIKIAQSPQNPEIETEHGQTALGHVYI